VLSDLIWYGAVAFALATGGRLLGPMVYHGVVVAAGVFLAAMGAVFVRSAWTAQTASVRVERG
jgi:hypothetical protein